MTLKDIYEKVLELKKNVDSLNKNIDKIEKMFYTRAGNKPS